MPRLLRYTLSLGGRNRCAQWLVFPVLFAGLLAGCGRLGFSAFSSPSDGSIDVDGGLNPIDPGAGQDAGDVGDAGAAGDARADSSTSSDVPTSDAGASDAGGSAGTCVLPPGLIVHLPLDEGAGTTTADATGNGHDGVLLQGPAWAVGRLGNALSFDGVDDEVNAGSGAAIDDLTTLTMCAWIFPRAFPARWPAIADKSADSFTGGWNFYADRDGEFGFLTNRAQFAEGGSVTRSEWAHVCASWDGSAGFAGIELYLNGVSIPHGRTGTNASGFASDASRDLAIGRVAGGGLEFDGIIDDYQLYGRVLSPLEIQQIANCAAP